MYNNETKEPILLSDILNNFFQEQLGDSEQWLIIKLWQSWPRLTKTDSILKQTKPVSYQNKRLILWVANSVELQELSFYTEELKHKINSYFQKDLVKEIFFTVNKDILQNREKSINLIQKILN